MTTVDMPREQFRLGMLLYDTRYRSLTIQVVALIAFMAFAAWLVNNTVQNLAALGKDFSFAFLGARAGYDISQTLIPYTSDSTHARAALVGIVNTLLVAVVGCFLATVIGVLMGVLRLSNNWIVARLAAVYVDGFRNIPVLLWILATMAVLTDMAPAPTASAATTPPPRCSSARSRSPTAGSTSPGRCSDPARRSWSPPSSCR
jgi:general L-amino acid transport system permease protein